MLFFTSPAKTLDETSAIPSFVQPTQPLFVDQATQVIAKMQELSPDQLQTLYSASEKIAAVNYDRLKVWQQDHNSANSRPALYMYKGDIFRELHVEEYQEEELQYAQKCIRILTGVYGYLRPLDLMQPYRLEMKNKLAINPEKNLGTFWQKTCTDQLNQEISTQNHKHVINLASLEYQKAVDFKALTAPIITINFKEYRNGVLKTVAINSKRARGMMLDYAVTNKVATLEQLKQFDRGGYKFEEEAEAEMLFVKK